MGRSTRITPPGERNGERFDEELSVSKFMSYRSTPPTQNGSFPPEESMPLFLSDYDDEPQPRRSERPDRSNRKVARPRRSRRPFPLSQPRWPRLPLPRLRLPRLQLPRLQLRWLRWPRPLSLLQPQPLHLWSPLQR